MNKARVLIFQIALAPYRLDIYNEMNKSLETKVIFLQKNVLVQTFDQEKLLQRLEVDYGFLTKGFRVFKRIIRIGISKEIKIFKPNTVVTVEYSSITIAVAFLKILPWFFYRHIIWTDDNPESVSNDNIIRRLLRSLLISKADGIIVVSDEAKELYLNHYKARCKIAVVPIIQMESQFLADLSISTLSAIKNRISYNLINKKVVLFVGRLALEKRVDRLLTAFGAINELHPDAVIVIVGDGPCRPDLEAFSEKLGISDRVLFAGRHEGIDLMAWYRLGGLFVLPSSFEPFGAVVNEALLAGIPVICSAKAGARELIEPGVNGEVVDASKIEELAENIDKWLKKTQTNTENNARRSLMNIDFSNAVTNFVNLIK